MTDKYTTITIPKQLADKVKEMIENTGFNSVSSFVTYVLRQIMSEASSPEPFSKEDEELVKNRLKALGYLE